MVDQEVIGSQLKSDRCPFQSEGDITLAVRNANHSLGPVMLHIVMKANAVIPPHVHKGMFARATPSMQVSPSLRAPCS
jgi:hypothetical protein